MLWVLLTVKVSLSNQDKDQECVHEISPQEGREVDGDIINADGGDDDLYIG